MERLKAVDPAGIAAAKRLSLAIGLSVLVHAWVASYAFGRPGDGAMGLTHMGPTPIHVLSPHIDVLTASLQDRVSVADASYANAPGAQRHRRAINALVAPDARYYTVDELDVLPVPRQSIRLPQSARGAGSVRLLTRIDASGRVTDVRIFDSAADAVQDAAAVETMRRSVFSAARKYGRPVRSEVVIDLPGTGGT